MRLVRGIEELRVALSDPRRAGERIGLVPTMGAFHAGHLSLMRRARQECEVVVVSLFVNPAQFNEAGDLATYPRDEQQDRALAEEAGIDYLFAPPVTEMYPEGFATTVSVSGLSEVFEGVTRGPGHFGAVATVVAKLFNIVQPDVAYFGQKDAQQALLIQRVVRDLAIPVQVEICPTIRETDGLAMSSRNQRLSGAERARASALHRSLEVIRQAVAAGEQDPQAARAQALAELSAAGVEPEYLELVTPQGLAPVSQIDGEVLALVAARVGETRLIDNELIQPLSTASGNGRG